MNIISIYLLTPFTAQNFKKLFEQIPSYEYATISTQQLYA